jgi:TolB protein
MQLSRYLGLGLTATALVNSACSPDLPVSPGSSRPAFTINDGAHAGNQHFFLLPPMVSQPRYSGSFDATRRPVVRITQDGAPLVDLNAAIPTGAELYQADWHTDEFPLDPTKTYRIAIQVNGFTLGFADVDVVVSGKELKNVNTGEYIPLLEGRTLPIKFRIEAGAMLAAMPLVFAEERGSSLTIGVMLGDGTQRKSIAEGTHPTWLGNTILTRGGFQENVIYSMDSTGANRHQILGAGPSYVPDLSPDGTQFILDYGDCGGNQHPIAIANVDGSNLHQTGLCGDIPRWSPLGDRVAYRSSGNLYSAKLDGTDVRQLTTVGTVEAAGWSPDAQQLVFSALTDGNYHLFLINADGSNQRQLTQGSLGDDQTPDWSPARNWIVFTSSRSGVSELWVTPADPAGSPTQITFAGGGQVIPRWRHGS